jgi:beta-phosphoglucomutase-like phosphatase (HAD superfamily)
VAEVIQAAKSQRLKLAWVTTTSQANIDSTLAAIGDLIQASDFDLVVNASMVQTPKPAPDAYIFALQQLAQSPEDCIAIENNQDGLQAARSAGLNCLAFPDENTADHNFAGAELITELDFSQLQAMLPIVA